MNDLSRYFTRKTLVFSVLGGLLFAGVEALASEIMLYSYEWKRIVVSGLVGFVLSAVLERLTEASSLIETAKHSIKAVSLFRQPADLLESAPDAHRQFVMRLLQASIGTTFRSIPGQRVDEYLNHLEEAISNSHRFDAVQRRPIRWFFADDRESYLHKLRECTMSKKRRVFVIDHNFLSEMQADLATPECMTNYWAHTGHDVETFWISSDEFEKAYRVAPPTDLVLFDERILVAYDETYRTLTFDVVDDDENDDRSERAIFRFLDAQLEAKREQPFRRIMPIAATNGVVAGTPA